MSACDPIQIESVMFICCLWRHCLHAAFQPDGLSQRPQIQHTLVFWPQPSCDKHTLQACLWMFFYRMVYTTSEVVCYSEKNMMQFLVEKTGDWA